MPGNQTQSEINDYLNETVNMYVPVFQWVGRPKVEPIDVKNRKMSETSTTKATINHTSI